MDTSLLRYIWNEADFPWLAVPPLTTAQMCVEGLVSGWRNDRGPTETVESPLSLLFCDSLTKVHGTD